MSGPSGAGDPGVDTGVSEPRRPGNPLALAILGCLVERPMHPYEMAATLRERGVERSVKLNYGSLYAVIDQLRRDRFIEALETTRDGRRPERTVYVLTAPGRALFDDWLRELIRVPVHEFPQFLAGLAFLAALDPDEVVTQLTERRRLLGEEIDAVRDSLRRLARIGLWRIFIIEEEYRLAMLEAERGWVERTIAEIVSDSLGGVAELRDFHRTLASEPDPERRRQLGAELSERIASSLAAQQEAATQQEETAT